MLTADMFTNFATTLTQDLVVVIPVALGIFATLYGVRLAIKYFKGIAK